MNPTDSFSALLLSRFEKAIQQSRRNVAAQERLGRCLDEIATIQTTFADNMTRAITSGIADVDIALGHTIGKDGFHDFSKALLLTMKQILEYSTHARKTGGSLRALVDPALEQSKNDARLLRGVESEEAKLRKQLENIHSNVEKNRKHYEKSICSLKDDSFLKSAPKKQERIADKSHPKTMQYFNAISEANRSLELLTSERKQLLDTLEGMERKRLHYHTHVMCTIANVFSHQKQNLGSSIHLIKGSIQGLCPEMQLQSFSTSRSARRSSCVVWPHRFNIETSVPLSEVQSRLVSAKKRLGPFGIPLEATMMIQRQHDALPIPRLVFDLIRAIRLRSGKECEGIFRKSVSSSNLESLQARIDSGNMEVLSTSIDALTAAALLKKYLRELPEPVITFALHAECTELGSHASPSDKQRVNIIVKRLPESRSLILKGIVDLVRELLKPENAIDNKMSPQAFAIVLAPALIQCPKDSPEVLLSHSENEVNFIGKLIQYLDTEAFGNLLKRSLNGQFEIAPVSYVHESDHTSARVVKQLPKVLPSDRGSKIPGHSIVTQLKNISLSPKKADPKASRLPRIVSSKKESMDLMQVMATEAVAAATARRKAT